LEEALLQVQEVQEVKEGDTDMGKGWKGFLSLLSLFLLSLKTLHLYDLCYCNNECFMIIYTGKRSDHDDLQFLAYVYRLRTSS
jgi:hypothetical protein